MTKLTNLTNELDALADDDWVYVWDRSTPANPDAKAAGARFRPAGAKITNYSRFEGNINIPALAAGVEGDASIAIAGAAVGDHVQFNLSAAPPTNIAILACWAEADAVKVRFRNTHSATAYAGASAACTALVTRSIPP